MWDERPSSPAASPLLPPGMGSPLVPGPPASVAPAIPDHVFYRLAVIRFLGQVLVLGIVAAAVAFVITRL